MNISCKLEDLKKTGVYIIINKKSNKFYIGSTTESIHKRLLHHLNTLKKGKHKNPHLQKAWNKYNECDWTASIIEICSKQLCLKREQYWLDKKDAVNKGYNINPKATGTPNLSKEVIKRRTKTFKKTINKASEYYKKVKDENLCISEIPKKYKKIVQAWVDKPHPWNKGKKYKSTEHLKVPKKSSNRESFKKKIRKQLPEIYVYDQNNRFLGKWNSAKDLEEQSIKTNFKLQKYMILRNKKGRNGHPPHVLQSVNINKSAKNNTKYKGLYFKYSPLL